MAKRTSSRTLPSNVANMPGGEVPAETPENTAFNEGMPVVVGTGDSVYPAAGAAVASEFTDDEMMDYASVPAAPMPASMIDEGPVDGPLMDGVYETTATESSVYETGFIPEPTGSGSNSRQALTGLFVMLGIAGTLLLFSWAIFNRSPRPQVADSSVDGSNISNASLADTRPVNNVRSGEFYPEEISRREEIRRRREALGLTGNTFNLLVDQLFYGKYPNLLETGPSGGRQALSDRAEDEPLRIRWDNIALDVLGSLESNFNQRSLAGLGSYSESDRTRWQNQVNEVNIDSRALYDLTDAKFSSLYPNQTDADFLEQPVGQLYYAIADSKANAIATGSVREDVRFATGAASQDFTARLGPGDGRIYTLQLSTGELLRLNLTADPADSTLLSVYSPNSNDSAIVADSGQTTWSGRVDETGTYEIVVVNTSNAAIDYQLAASVDRVIEEAPVAPEVTREEEELPSVSETADDADASSENESLENSDSTDN
ncbi:MAG: hypothetical protein AAFY72_16830 [Cyanobacteria bacterium J06649_4]